MSVPSTDGPGSAAASGGPRALVERLSRPPLRLCLANLPTPVERAPWLDAGAAEVWLKRDDASSELYGGGKVRKLEWVLGNPPFSGRGPVASVGGIGSHHLVALALFLGRLDRRLHALVFPQELSPHVRSNLAVLISSGARLWLAASRAGLPWAWLRYRTLERPEVAGTWMSAGASTALGGFGFVQAALELADQIDGGAVPAPSRIYLSTGTAGAAAGLAIGLGLAGVTTELRLVSAVEGWAFNRAMLGRMVGAVGRELRARGLDSRPSLATLERAGVRIRIDHAEVGTGYGRPTAAAAAAVELASAHGIALETTYTGKCLAALRRDLAGADPIRGPVLFWNTHGSNDLSTGVVQDWEARLPERLRHRLALASGGGHP